jgi:23S rRNA pseudouridine2605 synthase
MERLQKRIAESGICSRRKAEELITAGRVKVNGQVVKILGTKVSGDDVIEVDGKVIENEIKKYYVINKPRGVVCTASDDLNRTTIIDILPEAVKKQRIYPVGRLDYDTKGVLLLTNDGEFMNALVGPKSGIEKEYLVRAKGILTMTDVKNLTEGVVINNKKTLPANVLLESFDRTHGSTLVRITITEGNYHQVKEMFKAIDHEVKKLTRVRFGNITINNLKEGEIKELSIKEVKILYGLAKQSKNLSKHKE